MNTTRQAARRGFTLIEVLITIAVYSLIMIGVAALMLAMFSQSDIRLAALNTVDQVRITGMQFANEVRDAQTGSDGSYALAEANTSEIIMFSPYGAPSTTTVRRIRYFLQGSTLYKGIVTPSGSPLSYNLANEVVTPVISNVVATSSPAFTYYNGTYAGTSTPLTQPINLTQVRYIQLNLTLQQQETRAASSSFIFTAGASIRSLKSNLGN